MTNMFEELLKIHNHLRQKIYYIIDNFDVCYDDEGDKTILYITPENKCIKPYVILHPDLFESLQKYCDDKDILLLHVSESYKENNV